MQLRVSGAAKLGGLADRLRLAGDKELTADLRAGLRKAVEPLPGEIRDGMPAYLPDRYAIVLAGALRASTRVNTGTEAGVVVTLSAKGRKGLREIGAVDEGRLRHPVYGRYRRVKRHWVYRAFTIPNPWVLQKVRPGVISDPVERLGDELNKAVADVVADVTRKLAGR